MASSADYPRPLRRQIVDPPDPNSTLWRYMDFAKFVSLLSTRALHFARSDLMGDPFEGSTPLTNVELRKAEWGEDLTDNPDGLRKFASFNSQVGHAGVESTYLNCWHESSFESVAMWKLYFRDHGVAVRTTGSKLSNVLQANLDLGPHRHTIFLGRVRYIDFGTAAIPEGNMIIPFMHKRRSFQHEREVRAAMLYFPPVPEGKIPPEGEPLDPEYAIQPLGLEIPVDLDELIEAVYVNPETPPWIFELTKSVCERYGLRAPVLKSDLDQAPVF